MKNNNRNKIKIELPAGNFSGNCGDCVYANFKDKDRWGRVWCDRRREYNFSEDRNGCFQYKRDN